MTLEANAGQARLFEAERALELFWKASYSGRIEAFELMGKIFSSRLRELKSTGRSNVYS